MSKTNEINTIEICAIIKKIITGRFMQRVLVLFIISFLGISCIKKEQKVSGSGEVIKLLNDSQSDDALSQVNKLLEKDPENEELLYLKASALSMSAGVDVYKLFPILKMQIFDVAMNQWGAHREFEKKAKNRRNGVQDDTKLSKEDEKNIRTYKEPKRSQIKYTIDYSYIYSTNMINNNPTSFSYSLTYSTNLRDSGYYIQGNADINDPVVQMFDLNTRQLKKEYVENDSFFREKILDAILAAHKEGWERREQKRLQTQKEVKAAQAAWSILDMLPLIKTIPQIDKDQFTKLEEAQSILTALFKKNLETKNEVYLKSKKQLMMLSSLKLIGRFQSSIDLENINSPTDFICNTNESFAEQIYDGRKDVGLILYGLEDDGLKEKNKDIFEDLKARIERTNNNEEKNSEYREETIQEINNSLKTLRKTCNSPEEEEFQ
jgi:hypothetical protein